MTTTTPELTEEGTGRWIEAGGMRIHYHDVGQGPPMIMLHNVGPGGVTAWITFYKVLPALSQHFRCIAMDMPNFAHTGPFVYNEPVHNLQARTALALMDALGIEKAHLLGNSQGGQSAMVFASHYPDRVNKLVFGACHVVTGGDTYLFANTRRRARFPDGRQAFPPPTHDSIRAGLADYIDNDTLITDDLVNYLYKTATDRPDLAEARSKSVSTYYDHIDDMLENVNHPTLIIWGRYDRICPVEVGVKFLNHLPNSRLVVLNDCGHWIPFEKPEEWLAYVLDFLNDDWA